MPQKLPGYFSPAVLVLYIATALYTSPKRRSGATDDADSDDDDEGDVGVAARTKQLPRGRKAVAVGTFLASGAFILYFGAEPFINAVLAVAGELGVSQFVLIQWVAPFLSEFPESLTAFLWASMIVLAPKGLSNLISSKLNQWTLLIAAIPLAYSVGVGHPATVPLTTQGVDELFLLQFFIPVEPIRVIIAWIYLILAVGFLLVNRRNLRFFHELRSLGRRAGDDRR